MSITLFVALVLASSAVCAALTMLAYARMPERRVLAAPLVRGMAPTFSGCLRLTHPAARS
jgi:hypothetical protein